MFSNFQDPASHGKVLRNIFPKQIEFQSIGDELLWKKPASLTLIGSFAASCAVLRASHVDVLLEIPEVSFTLKVFGLAHLFCDIIR